jgi:hypothetical protein
MIFKYKFKRKTPTTFILISIPFMLIIISFAAYKQSDNILYFLIGLIPTIFFIWVTIEWISWSQDVFVSEKGLGSASPFHRARYLAWDKIDEILLKSGYDPTRLSQGQFWIVKGKSFDGKRANVKFDDSIYGIDTLVELIEFHLETKFMLQVPPEKWIVIFPSASKS